MAVSEEHFLSEQIAILERIASGAPLSEILTRIVLLIEQTTTGLCSILLLDAERGVVHHGAAPSLPADYVQAIDGSAIGPAAGSCGTAAYLARRVIVSDLANHPYWANYKELALRAGLRACWSSPIFSSNHEVLGTFAVYYDTPREPTLQELARVDSATHLAAIAIGRERDAAEKKKLEAQVALAQRMESIGTLAGGIAHEFNNVLSAIVGNLSLAHDELADDHPVSARLSVVLDAADRAAQLVSQILAFSRRREIRRVPIELRPVVEEALRLLRATFPAMVEITTELDDACACVLADASQIHQIVLNLGTNALHAMGSRGVLRLQLAQVELSAPLQGIAQAIPKGRYVRLSVIDSGCGMDAAQLTRIFDPFFTTKEPGQGTGLGLSVVLGIVHEHGGTLLVESKPGEGTRFDLYFPETLEPLPEATKPSRPVARGAGRRVLCVDDEAAIISLEKHVLTSRGFEVEGFTDPCEALATFARAPERFQAIVTDFAMVGMSGTELIRSALLIRPDIPIILTSGYLDSNEEARARELGVHELLTKPNFLPALVETLGRLC